MTGGNTNVSEMTGGESLAIRLNSSLKRTQTRQSSKNERKTASRSGAEGQKNESGSAARSQTEENPPAICCRNRKTHSKPLVASPSPASVPVRSLCIKWMTTGPDIPRAVNGSVTLKDEPHLRPALDPAQPGDKLPLRKISPISNRKELFHARQNRPLQATRHRLSKGNDAPAFTQMLALAAHSLSDMRLYEKELYLSMLQTEHPANNREQIARNRTLTSAVSFLGRYCRKAVQLFGRQRGKSLNTTAYAP